MDPVLAHMFVESVVGAVMVPVRVNVGGGWDYSLFAAPDLARRFQDAGAQMITLHARFAKQGFDGEADWRLIQEMRSSVTVPLIGNGDVKTPEDALRMLRETGCDGVMAGRVAISNPWALARLACALRGDPEPAVPTLAERIRVAMEHLRTMIAVEADVGSYEEALESPVFADAQLRACRQLRGQVPMYIKGEFGASQIRNRLTQCSTVAEYEDVLSGFAASVAAG
jgi:tRNA-dihydrouridine synthase